MMPSNGKPLECVWNKIFTKIFVHNETEIDGIYSGMYKQSYVIWQTITAYLHIIYLWYEMEVKPPIMGPLNHNTSQLFEVKKRHFPFSDTSIFISFFQIFPLYAICSYIFTRLLVTYK